MQGPKLYVRMNEKEVILRPLEKKELPTIIEGFSDLEVIQYVGRISVPTLEMEEEWFKKETESKSSMIWGIEYKKKLIGVTDLHDMNGSSASTGVVIWEKKLWGQGLVSMAHLARTWYASEILNIHLLRSHVWNPNVASRKALKRLGYTATGSQYFKKFHMGEWLDLTEMLWINPRYSSIFLNNRKDCSAMFTDSLKRAQESLDLAKKVVSYK